MSWYRIAVANYPHDISNRVFAGEADNRIPRKITLETSQFEENPTAVNVVYYYDLENDVECGDFFFESIPDALNWCVETLFLDRERFHFYTPFLEVG